MQKHTPLNQLIVENLLWFLGSLVVAFFVWMIANAQMDPIEQWRLLDPVPIRVTPSAGMIVTNQDTFASNASVMLRGPSSVRELLAADDVIVYADLSNLDADSHVVELHWSIAPERRARVVDISPRQITVDIEPVASKLVEVQPNYTGSLPDGFQIVGEPRFDINQVTISGPASHVAQVSAVMIDINLNGHTTSFDDDARPIPVDPDGTPIDTITLDRQIIQFELEITTEDTLGG